MEPPENDSPEKIILRWDSTASVENRHRMIFNCDRHEVERYLHAVDEIQRSLDSTTISSGGDDRHPTIQIAMARLEDEFRNILAAAQTAMVEAETNADSSSHGGGGGSSHGAAGRSSSSSEIKLNLAAYEDLDNAPDTPQRNLNHQDSGSSTFKSMNSIRIREVDLLPLEAILDLRSIADRMIAAGCTRECIQVYASLRKETVEKNLRDNLGIERLSIGDIQRLEWDVLERKIRRWMRAAVTAITVVFASEKKLCEEIFEGLGTTSVADLCFMETIKAPAVQLFNFAEAISISRRSPEKLFKIVDLHDALQKLLPFIEIVFDSKSSESIRVQAVEILSRLAEAARGILSEFENAVLREPSKGVPGGTIHPVTRYVMNYISLISDYKTGMNELIVSKPSTGSRYSGDPNMPELDLTEYEEHTPLALHLVWIIVVLQFNIDVKSQHYKDPSLSHLFMMNNVHYITEKIKNSDLRAMIGDNYLRRLTGKFRQAATGYQRSTWVKVLHCLRDEGLHVSGSFSSGVSKSALRERFKMFNAMFEEVHRTQATWLIPDAQLREELRISMSEKLIPAYRSFLGRFRSHIESGRHPENYIKYSVEDLENAVLDFFEGYPVSQHLRRRSG